MPIQWLTTAGRPNGTHKGWRTHVVSCQTTETRMSIGRRRAVCGTLPRYGWDVDLFIEQQCAACLKRLQKFPRLTE